MILMLNCSYKSKNGNTAYFLDLLEKELGDGRTQTVPIRRVLDGGFPEFAESLEQAEALVIGAPLYVDGLPAQGVRLLELLLEWDRSGFAGKPVYVLSNLGFYEGEQTCNLFDIVKNWCARMGMVYGGGLAVGAGPMIRALGCLPLKKGLNRDIGRGLEALADAIRRGGSMENIYAGTRIPRSVYLQAAHISFRRSLKKRKK